MKRLVRVDPSRVIAALPSLDWSALAEPGTYAMIEKFDIDIDDVVAPVQALYPGRRRGMTCFSRLTPGQFIPPHQDRHDGGCDARVHVPLTTNPSVVFVSGDRAAHMDVGWAWVIDPRETHSVANGGDTDRIHLFWNMRQ